MPRKTGNCRWRRGTGDEHHDRSHRHIKRELLHEESDEAGTPSFLSRLYLVCFQTDSFESCSGQNSSFSTVNFLCTITVLSVIYNGPLFACQKCFPAWGHTVHVLCSLPG
jgi:hypothetical protein